MELIHELRRQRQLRAGLELAWRDNWEAVKSDHALQIAEIARSVSSQQDLANIRRREMGDLTSRAETILREEQGIQRRLRARLHHLNVSFQITNNCTS